MTDEEKRKRLRLLELKAKQSASLPPAAPNDGATARSGDVLMADQNGTGYSVPAAEVEAMRQTKGWVPMANAPALDSGTSPSREGPSKLEAGGLGAAQGATLGFGDEAGGVVQALGAKYLPESLGGDSQAAGRPFGELYRQNRDAIRGQNLAAEHAQPGAYLGGNLVGGLPSAIASGGGVAAMAALGATNALGDSTAESAGGMAGDAVLGGAIGGVAGAAGKALGGAMGWLSDYAGGKVAAIEGKVLGDAAKEAAAVTRTARSAAGNAAQDAYKQLEHLRELGRLGQLSPEQTQVAQRLASELGDKAQDKLLASAAQKEAAAQTLRETAATEGERAKQLAAQKLGSGELRSQVSARAKRYGLPALGGLYGALRDDHTNKDGSLDLMGLATGGGVGALTGAGLRPMMGSLIRMAKQPVVQRGLWRALQGLTGFGETMAPAVENSMASTGRATQPSLRDALMPMIDVAGPRWASDEDVRKEEEQSALARALLGPMATR